jgi:hypothetical protein
MNDGLLISPSRPIGSAPRDRVTALASASARQRRPIVVVLGMHRSGTPLCSHILSALGVDMADDVGADPSNARGHWERWEIVEFHDRILGLFNRDYRGRFHDFPLPVACKPPHRQIPIVVNRQPGGPRVPSWEAFGRRPSERARIATTGRHPKPFT